MSAAKLNWGIMGTGSIAKAFARALPNSKRGTLYAVGSRTQESADKFGQEFSVPKRHGSYEALLADPQVQAVYISTPHPHHAEWAIKAAEAGKHILCEKPITMNAADAMAVIEAAVRHNVFLMEAFMYRCHPQIQKLVELLREKAIGEVRVIQANFGFHAGFNATSRIWANEHGGGGILDVGCYTMSMARLIAGVAAGKDGPAEPEELKATGVLNPVTGVDEYSTATLRFPGGIIAQLATAVGVNLENVVRIFGSEGSILISDPWIPAREGGTVKIVLKKHKEKEPQTIAIESGEWLYGLEADTVAQHLDARQAAFPAMTPADTVGNMRGLDLWREQIGLVYNEEKPEAKLKPIHKRPLAKRADAQMTYAKVPGLEKPFSRLIMGCDNQPNISHASVMFDDFFERGGTSFDTAHIYGGGKQEKLLGQWIKNRNIREQVQVIVKGAHTPNCNPKALSSQLLESLDRIQSPYADLYLMHRDNPEIPVAEFVDVLNEHKKAGRIKAFGGSNWALERVEAANAYAKSKGLTGFAAVSNNFSLARMVEPPWGGCISASDKQSRQWFEKTQTALFAWSSQARGFFVLGDPKFTSDKELVRCWYAEDNFKRLERVKELSKKRNVLPINVALAYVLAQPFPTFALFGPRQLSETRTSFPGLGISLSPQDLKFLNLED